MVRILAHGVDLVDLADFERLLKKPDGEFAKRCFTSNELDKAGVGHRRTERLAARFAAKEAVLKALGTGWVTGISWKEIELHSAPNGSTVAMASVIAIGHDGATLPK